MCQHFFLLMSVYNSNKNLYTYLYKPLLQLCRLLVYRLLLNVKHSLLCKHKNYNMFENTMEIKKCSFLWPGQASPENTQLYLCPVVCGYSKRGHPLWGWDQIQSQAFGVLSVGKRTSCRITFLM